MIRNMVFLLSILFVCSTISSTYATTVTPVPLKRLALIVGSNTGYKSRVQLKYAGRDAQAVADLLVHIGGVEQCNVLLLQDPTIKDVVNGLAKIKGVAGKESGIDRRTEFVLYYSGHADERGLLLGNELLSYTDLRNAIDQMPVDVRIVILDACASGGITREKGGIKRPPFLFDASSEMKGHAFLTSSSLDEAAQESDKLKGSLFTCNLVSGLRGAADANLDGKVTLDESYQYAFHETLKETEGTYYGPQHPAYDIRLKGTGDLVLTDLRASSAGMRFPESITGTIFVRDTIGNLVAEFNKSRGQPMVIGFNPGSYNITLDMQGQVFTTVIVLAKDKFTEIDLNGLKIVKREVNTIRGDRANEENATRSPDSSTDRVFMLTMSIPPDGVTNHEHIEAYQERMEGSLEAYHERMEDSIEHYQNRVEDSIEAYHERVENSIEHHQKRVEDSLERVEEIADRVQDSIWEAHIGLEGRTLRISYVFCSTIQNGRLQILYGPAISNRFGLCEIGFQEIAFNQSEPDGNHYYLTISPSIGLVPFLARPIRFSIGIGNTFQFETNNDFRTCISPFVYMSGTCFFVKRISSTVSMKYRYVENGDFSYWSSKHRPIEKGSFWPDLGLSMDFYF